MYSASESHCFYCFGGFVFPSFHTGLFQSRQERAETLKQSKQCGERLRLGARSGMRSHLYRVPSPQPLPQHQVESILVSARGALLCKGQEGVGGGDVEQGWDPVGDPSLVFLLEQRAVGGARCHFFHDLCKDRRQLNVCPSPKCCPAYKFRSITPFLEITHREGETYSDVYFCNPKSHSWSQKHTAWNKSPWNMLMEQIYPLDSMEILHSLCPVCFSRDSCIYFCQASRGNTGLDCF